VQKMHNNGTLPWQYSKEHFMKTKQNQCIDIKASAGIKVALSKRQRW